MAKTLIIAEKPSVANDLQRVLGRMPGMTKFENHKEYFENDTHVISSAIGHLLELAMPNTPDGKKPKWDFASLPIIPEEFELVPIEKTGARLKVLAKLIKRKDVAEIVNACDAGREGELIFRNLIRHTGTTKPTRRLWMQSMTNQAILDAFEHLRNEQEMNPLSNAAVCRAESDWLVGINGTRALTAFNSRNGGFRKTPVGRVQTPTLTILVEREKEIQQFVPRTYFEVFGDFDVAAGSYRGRWFEEKFSRPEGDPHARAERLWDRESAEAIRERCQGRTGTIEEKKKPQKQGVPLLYDLTSLQREANGRFGFSARRTLQIAQALYEQYKALTYPRTDSRFLPEDYIPTVKEALGTFADLTAAKAGAFPADLIPHAATALRVHGVHPNKRIFDNSKVSDHFAIIPTGQVPRTLDEAAAKLFRLVTQRFIAAFFPSAEFEITTRITRIDGDAFRTDGKVLVSPGWLAVYGKEAEKPPAEGAEGEGRSLVPVVAGEPARDARVEVREDTTKPPPHYTEATILSAMEGAGKLVDDEELAAAMSERGLGTPATRASIIEGLINEKYILRDKKDLLATQKGIQLVEQLRDIGTDVLSSPELTGQWEYKLKEMEHGKLSRERFMDEIRAMTRVIVDRTRDHASKARERVFPDVPCACPACGTSPIRQMDAYYDCRNPECKGFRIYKNISGRELGADEAETLFRTGLVGPLTGFRSRRGVEFEAMLELKEEDGKFKASFVFGDEPEQEIDPSNIDEEAVVCRHANGRIIDTGSAYALLPDGGDAFDKRVRLPKTLCKRELPREQARKFFEDGRTDVIEGFISKKGRPFSASLHFEPEGKRTIRWEFPPRAPKKKAAGKNRAKKQGAEAS